jgi:hypothetical protein
VLAYVDKQPGPTHDSAVVIWYLMDMYFMDRMDRMVSRSSCGSRNSACLVVLLCACVVAQMLGAPVTLLDLLNSDMITESEPISEDLSTLSPSSEVERPGLFRVLSEFRPVLRLPLLTTSVFRPPSA